MQKIPPSNYGNQEREPDGRWVSKLGISKKTQPMSVKLPELLDGIVRSLSEEDLIRLCGEKTRSDYLRIAIVNQLRNDGLLPSQETPPEPKSQTRKKKKPTPIAEQANSDE